MVQQYWDTCNGAYQYISVAAFADALQQTQTAHEHLQALEEPYVALHPKCDDALFTHKFALSCGLLSLPSDTPACFRLYGITHTSLVKLARTAHFCGEL